MKLSEMSDDAPDKITFVFEEAETPTSAVTGVFGGSSLDGRLLSAHFYVERATVPHSVSHEVENGQIDVSEGDTVRRGDVTREVQTSLVMTPEHAIEIGKWLMDQGERLIEQRE
jgi:hypothetical protein